VQGLGFIIRNDQQDVQEVSPKFSKECY